MDELFLKICAGLVVVLLFMIWLEIRGHSKRAAANDLDRKIDERRSDVEIWLYQINENIEKMATSMEGSGKPSEQPDASDK